MLHTIRQFFTEEYDEIMRDIKHKITVYLQLAIGRARFIRNRSRDIRGNVEQTIRILTEEMDDLGWKDELPEEMNPLLIWRAMSFWIWIPSAIRGKTSGSPKLPRWKWRI